MNRRQFLSALIGGVAVAAAARTFPFRVFSFPATPVVLPTYTGGSIFQEPIPFTELIEPGAFDNITMATLRDLQKNIIYDNFFRDTPWLEGLRKNQSIELESRISRELVTLS